MQLLLRTSHIIIIFNVHCTCVHTCGSAIFQEKFLPPSVFLDKEHLVTFELLDTDENGKESNGHEGNLLSPHLWVWVSPPPPPELELVL